MAADCSVFKFLHNSVDGNHLIRFHSESAISRFLRGCVNRALHQSIELDNCSTLLVRDDLWRWPFIVSRPSSDTTDSKSVELKFKEPELVPERTPRDYTVHFPQEKSQDLSKTYKTSGPVVPDTIRYQWVFVSIPIQVLKPKFFLMISSLTPRP